MYLPYFHPAARPSYLGVGNDWRVAAMEDPFVCYNDGAEIPSEDDPATETIRVLVRVQVALALHQTQNSRLRANERARAARRLAVRRQDS